MGNVTAESLKEVGAELLEALISLVSTDGRLPRPTDLSRVWSLDQTLCVRTCSALRNDDPLRALHQLPATGSLRTVLEAGRARGVAANVCGRAGEAIDHLEDAIASLGGRKSNLDTLIGSQLVDAREKIEATSKQSIFRGMSNLLGLQNDVVLTTFFVYPSVDSDEWCDELAIYGSHGLRRLRPELTILVGGRVLSGESDQDLPQAEQVLHGGRLDRSGYSVALKSLSTDPFPEVDLVADGKRLLYTLPGDDAGESRELSMFFASIDKNASPRYRRREMLAAPFVFLPRNPSKDMLLDVFVHPDVWRGVVPRLEINRGQNLLTPTEAPSRGIDRHDFCESLHSLGTDPRGMAFKPFPRYGDLVATVCEHADLELAEFRHYRLYVKYPVVALSYGIYFQLPDRPVPPFYSSTGSR